MTREEVKQLFTEIYNTLTEHKIKLAPCVVLNFKVPKDEQKYVFGYCLNDQCVFEVKGYCLTTDLDVDLCSEISLNPKVLKMNLECIRSTIAHELIHTVKGCEEHNEKFLKVGTKVKKILNLENDLEFYGTQEESDILWNL